MDLCKFNEYKKGCKHLSMGNPGGGMTYHVLRDIVKNKPTMNREKRRKQKYKDTR